MKKLFFLLAALLHFTTIGHAQLNQVCETFEAANPNSFILDPIGFFDCGDIINPASFTNVLGATHGTPRVVNTPGNQCSGSSSLLMGVTNGGCGEGFFINYNFQAGRVYNITFNSKLWNGSSANVVLSNYSLNVRGTTGLTHSPTLNNTCSSCAENAFSVQPTSQSLIEQLSFSTIAPSAGCHANILRFYPCQNYSQLWFFPTSTSINSGVNAGILIDDLCISESMVSPIISCRPITFFNATNTNGCNGTVSPASVPGLAITHGTPRIVNNGCGASNAALFLNSNGGNCGEGITLDYNFQANTPYRIVLKTLVTTLPPPGTLGSYSLNLMAVNQVGAATGNCDNVCSQLAPAPTGQSLQISQLNYTSLGANGNCISTVLSFTSNANYTRLYLHPTSTVPVGEVQVGLIIDDICIERQCGNPPFVPYFTNDDPSNFIAQDLGNTTQAGMVPGLSIWPNPSSGKFSIELKGYENSIETGDELFVNVYNAYGQMVFSQPMDGDSRLASFELGQQHGNGFYLVSLMKNGQRIDVKRLVVSR